MVSKNSEESQGLSGLNNFLQYFKKVFQNRSKSEGTGEREVEAEVTPVGQARDQQEDEWDRARKAIERREAVAVSDITNHPFR
jgi:hypothetical protein